MSTQTLEARLRATALSEWIKFRSVRSGPAVLSAAAVIVLLGSWLICVGYRSGWSRMSAGDQASFDPVYTSMRGIELAQLFIGALGVITVTGEYTSGLIRGTFIATPQRGQVLAWKALVFAAVVWLWSTALSFGAFLLGQRLLTGPVPHVGIGDRGVLTAVFGGGLYLTMVGLLGLFTGVLLRRTAAALVALFGLLLVVPVVAGLLPGAFGGRTGEFMPSGAGEEIWKIVHSGRYDLGPWPGFAVFAGYLTAAALAAFVLVRRRDA